MEMLHHGTRLEFKGEAPKVGMGPECPDHRCPHRDVPLSMGSLQADGTLQCLYHGIRFDREGHCTFIPEQEVIPAGCQVKSYPLRESGEWVWVFMGNPARRRDGEASLPMVLAARMEGADRASAPARSDVGGAPDACA
jgi:phenylpropionate dioxygenase-like ring-hydroxylating dioxygenase large terminal subunit